MYFSGLVHWLPGLQINLQFGLHVCSTGDKCFMLTKLLVGDAVELKPDTGLRFPPTVPGEDGRRYDTVTGTTNGSKVYVVYENGTYPLRELSMPSFVYPSSGDVAVGE